MKAVVTVVSHASVTVDGAVVGEINPGTSCGLMALVGVGAYDTQADADYCARKLSELRILPGELSALDTGAPLLVISQFTLMGATAKGRRPSWSAAAPGDAAKPLIDYLCAQLREKGLTVAEGQFGAMMEVTSTNMGPFTVIVDSRN